MNLLKTFSTGLATLALASTAMAQTFWDSGVTIQSKSIDLNYGGRVYKWAALSTNGNISASTTSNASPANIDFEGNVGVWGNSANLILTNSRIQGDLYIRKNGTTTLSGTGGWSGTKFQGNAYDTVLSTAASHIATLSSNINSLSQTSNFTSNFSLSGGSIIGNNSTLSITATNSSPVVLKLTDFKLSGGSLTLSGSSSSKFVINVTKDFLLSNSADVILTGGLKEGNVIFNVTTGQSTGTLGLSGGSTLGGILVASNRAVALSGASTVFGQVVGKSIALSGGSKIKKPVVISP
jgi:hypothetical protein